MAWNEDDETEALEVVYAWLGGDRAARTLLTHPEYDALVANIAQALADRSAAIRAMQADRQRLEDFAIAMINAPDDSAADWGYDLAHLLDGDQ